MIRLHRQSGNRPGFAEPLPQPGDGFNGGPVPFLLCLPFLLFLPLSLVLQRLDLSGQLRAGILAGSQTGADGAATATPGYHIGIAVFRYVDLLALPVVDAENRLVGIVTIDDAIDVLREEMTEDIEKMAAIATTDKPYLKTSVVSTWLKRMPWLALLMISATFTGTIIASYENALANAVILTAFIPMLMDTGGNAGSQVSVTVIRGLSLGEITLRDIFSVVRKEFCVSLLCGGSLALLGFAKLILIDHTGINVAATVAITLLAAVIFAKLIGCVLPIIVKSVGLDPALVSSPLITTIADAVSLMIYFRVATVLIPNF